MKWRCGWLGCWVFLAVVHSVSAGERPFDCEACLSRTKIELGTYAALTVCVKNNSKADLAVSEPRFELPTRYRSCKEPAPEEGPSNIITLKAGEIRFWSYPVPADVGFTSLLVGSYTTTVMLEVRAGEARERFVGIVPGSEDTRLPPAPSEGREILRIPIHYQIVQPSDEMELMRQRYTRETEACDALDEMKRISVYQLDVVAAGRDAEARVGASQGSSTTRSPTSHRERGRAIEAYQDPAYREMLAFAAYRGTDYGNVYPYNGALRSLDAILEGRYELPKDQPSAAEVETKTLSELSAANPWRVSYAMYLAGRVGAEDALKYLKGLDVRRFNCADRAFYHEFVDRITGKLTKEREADTRLP